VLILQRENIPAEPRFQPAIDAGESEGGLEGVLDFQMTAGIGMQPVEFKIRIGIQKRGGHIFDI
jgi:hypothetical protein